MLVHKMQFKLLWIIATLCFLVVATHISYMQLLIFLLGGLTSFLLYSLVSHHLRPYSLHRAMELAIKNNEFFPEYQPIYDIYRKAYSGVEVLLRWQDGQDKIIMPDFFIEEAEATGLIVPITLQIAKIAFEEARTILKNNPDFHLAFNLSALHFKSLHFFNQFIQLQNESGITPHQIIFEITERELLNKNDLVFSKSMQTLREAGFALAIDDYGTGHASISYLQHFPFNYLKIDKLFIQAIGTKAITESLNDAIIRMAKELKLVIIAEGVETQAQFDYLLKHEVRYLQGWYFSKAVSMERIHTLLEG